MTFDVFISMENKRNDTISFEKQNQLERAWISKSQWKTRKGHVDVSMLPPQVISSNHKLQLNFPHEHGSS
jgi:hypothetical protein